MSQSGGRLRVIQWWGSLAPLGSSKMPMHLRLRLSGIVLVVGGLTAGICHLFNFESPTNVSQLPQYVRFGAPVHLLLFAAGIMVLLAIFELYSMQRVASGVVGCVALTCVFLGILCGDLLHCVLEFSVFPVLSSMVPYAVPGIAEATYHSAVLADLISAGGYLMFGGIATTAISMYLNRTVRLWPAIPLTVAAALLGLDLFPQLTSAIHPASVSAFYLSLAVLGVSVLSSSSANSTQRRAKHD
jgi:hypothetical protein